MTISRGNLIEVEGYGGIAFFVDEVDGDQVVAHMVGDDRPHHLDVTAVTPLDEDVCSCGQIGCAWA